MIEAKVLGLIPAWNEAARVGLVVRQLLPFMPVLVVDDGSQDATASVAQDAGATVIRHRMNMGKGVALREGFKHGMEAGYDAILTLDADGQHNPAEAPKFMDALAEGAGDLIIGRRDFSRMPLHRGIANRAGSAMLSWALGEKIYDNQSGYRLHARGLLECLDLTRPGFDMEVEIVIQAVVRGMRIGWVDIQTIYGIGKRSYFHPLRDSIKFISMLLYGFRYRRTFEDSSSHAWE
jgi:glycosyltransferase involved in cell wall biosynthesis